MLSIAVLLTFHIIVILAILFLVYGKKYVWCCATNSYIAEGGSNK